MIQHPSCYLFEELSRVCPYPSGVTAVPRQILGTSFFPGGTGLWHDGSLDIPSFPIGGVMVLGHDFHSVAGYKQSLLRGAENMKSSTWRHLLPFLSQVPIPLRHCFFTNAYMGLREGTATTGVFPGANSPDFVKRCQEFLLLQIATQQPSLILALGKYVPIFLAPLSLRLAPWARAASFSERDSLGLALVDDVLFEVPKAHPCVVASIVHPSFRPSNVRHRRWANFTGDLAELALVQEAVARSRPH